MTNYQLAMKNILSISCFIFILLHLTGCDQADKQAIDIVNAWIREAPPNATAMAGYMQIKNHTNKDKLLVSGTSEDFKIVEFHRSVEKNGVYRMIRHKQLTIPANGTLELKPGDFHLMLITPYKKLNDGDLTTINLVFADDSIVSHEFPIKKAVFE